ncbi:MAG: TolC family protein [Burkholderiaceae bacterium]
MKPLIRRAAGMVLVVSLAGCASFSDDAGFGAVQRATRDQLALDVQWTRDDEARQRNAERVAKLLATPLSADAAVQVALLNNRGLQASFAELGIAEADLVQAGRLPNPGFGIARLRRDTETEIERSIHFNLARLILAPKLTELERRRFERTQRAVAMETLALAAETRKAYYRAVAAEEGVRYQRKVRAAAEASAELARRMANVGNFNRLQQAREHGFYADAALGFARAEQHMRATRERLIRLMGLWGSQTAFRLPERLPDLPKAARELPDVERQAMSRRLDLAAARIDAEQMAANLGLTRTTRFINVLELGAVRNSSNQASTQRGFELGFELPLFDWGGARVAKAEAIYMQAVDRAAQIAIDARSEVREAYTGYRAAFDIARHYRDEIVPTRQRIAEENLLRYNGMLIGVFELLADARMQIASVSAYIESLRDFWIAHADLDMALVGKPSLSAASGGGTTPTAPADAGGH